MNVNLIVSQGIFNVSMSEKEENKRKYLANKVYIWWSTIKLYPVFFFGIYY